jgi:hypothetical protein
MGCARRKKKKMPDGCPGVFGSAISPSTVLKQKWYGFLPGSLNILAIISNQYLVVITGPWKCNARRNNDRSSPPLLIRVL